MGGLLGWGPGGDLWCIGCLFYFMYTGTLLFNTQENEYHLAMMEKVRAGGGGISFVPYDTEFNAGQRWADPEGLIRVPSFENDHICAAPTKTPSRAPFRMKATLPPLPRRSGPSRTR